jgi:hypothetical protein
MTVFSGTRLSGPVAQGGEAYGPITVAAPSGSASVDVGLGLAPGVWLHHISVAATGQVQHTQTLLVADSAAANVVQWSLFQTVLTVNEVGDNGDGRCDAACTLRDAVETAAQSSPPVLIQFAPSVPSQGMQIQITNSAPIVITTTGTVIDGTDAAGDPSPLADFDDRIYPTTITLIAPNANPTPGAPCPCTEGNGGSLRVETQGVRIIGVALRRQLAPEGLICCGDQDLVAFDAGSQNSTIRNCQLDGGAAAIASAEVPRSQSGPPTGKDCVDAEDTGATSDEPVTIENSELRFCYDRALKSKAGFVHVVGNWVHHNLRGGLFVQSPQGSQTAEGVVYAAGNLLEENGRNCPSGDPHQCGPLQVVTRDDASELALQGALTRVITAGNVIRNGVMQGIFFQDEAAGTIANDYVCGINSGTSGRGIVITQLWGNDSDISVRGTAVVYCLDSGVRINDAVAGDFGIDGDLGAGNNAFTQNGSFARRNFVNAGGVAFVRAQGNQWEDWHPSNADDPDLIDANFISDNDTNNTIGIMNLVDVTNPLSPQSAAAPRIDTVEPAKAVQGGLVSVTGQGFDAISGHAGGTQGHCTGLAAGNSCDPVHGTCLEFLVGDSWVPAQDVLGVTPTHLVVRSPLTCTVGTRLRVRRLASDGSQVVSNEFPFCRNTGNSGTPTPHTLPTATPTPNEPQLSTPALGGPFATSDAVTQ